MSLLNNNQLWKEASDEGRLDDSYDGLLPCEFLHGCNVIRETKLRPMLEG